jgi:CPA2 family monovalent cation:H+ antiporter-2
VDVMFRARNRYDAYELMDLGIQDVYRESIDTSIRLGVDALVKLGKRRYSAYRAGQNFFRYDESAMRKLMTDRHDMEQYIIKAKAAIAMQEDLLKNERQIAFDVDDHAWDSEMMRQAIQEKSDPS